MREPSLPDLGHDLRNLLGLVRALSAELGGLLPEGANDAREVWADLDRHSRFSLDALRVIEKWNDPAPVEVHLGALVWSARLFYRELNLGDVSCAPRTTVVVPDAVDAIRSLLGALGGGRGVTAECEQGIVTLRRAAGASVRADELAAAMAALETCGIGATVDASGVVKLKARST